MFLIHFPPPKFQHWEKCASLMCVCRSQTCVKSTVSVSGQMKIYTDVSISFAKHRWLLDPETVHAATRQAPIERRSERAESPIINPPEKNLIEAIPSMRSMLPGAPIGLRKWQTCLPLPQIPGFLVRYSVPGALVASVHLIDPAILPAEPTSISYANWDLTIQILFWVTIRLVNYDVYLLWSAMTTTQLNFEQTSVFFCKFVRDWLNSECKTRTETSLIFLNVDYFP